MTNRQLKRKIREAFAHGTPDISQEIMMDTLFSDPQEEKEVISLPQKSRSPVRFPVFSVAAAACAAIAVLAISINLIVNRPQSGGAALITAEEAMNAVQAYPFEKPTAAVAPHMDCQLNDNAAAPQYDVTLSYGDLIEYKFVVDAKTGEVLSMEQVPQKTDPQDPITVEEAMQIVLMAAELEESQITDSVFEMYLVTDNPHYDITFRSGNGLYRYKVHPYSGEILDKQTLMTADSISEEMAKDIALIKAQVTADQISNYCIEWDGDEWPIHYDISFIAQGVIYEFEIHAISGEILEMEAEPMVEDFISLDDAKAIALVSVQLTESQITAYSSNFKNDSRNPYYSIVFVADNVKYDFEIHAITGDILKSDTEPVSLSVPTPGIVVIPPISVALKHAGLTQGEVANLESHGDLDDGVLQIDVSFIAKGLKYEYEITAGGKILDYETEPMEDDFISQDKALQLFDENLDVSPALLTAKNISIVSWNGRMCYDIVKTFQNGSDVGMKIDATTGAVLSKEIPDGLQTSPTPPDGKLSADQATSIALSQIGLTSKEQVTDFESEEDRDDSPPHYDISFEYQGMEYEFEIGMYDGGSILSGTKEPAD